MDYIIIIGNPIDGISALIGPFDSNEKAFEYAEIHLNNETWYITPLESPEKDEGDEEEEGFGNV